MSQGAALPRFLHRKRLLSMIFGIALIAILLLAIPPYLFPKTTEVHVPHTTMEKQLSISTGILSWNMPNGSQYYQWETILRATTKSFVVSIKAVLNLSESGTSIEQTRFGGITPIGIHNPLNYNQTTSSGTEITPPTQGFFRVGQSFPEIVTVTFLNGTSVSVRTIAVVWTLPTRTTVAPTIAIQHLTASVNQSNFSALTLSISLRNTGDATITRLIVFSPEGSFENIAPGQTVSGTFTDYRYPVPKTSDIITVEIEGTFTDSSYFIYTTTVKIT